MSATDATTTLLNDATQESQSARARLAGVVYSELRDLAASYLRSEKAGHTLGPTALVHEAYLRLINQREVDPRNRSQFFALGATAMRRILVDHARARKSAKRGGNWQRVELDDLIDAAHSRGVDLVDLHEAMEKLSALDLRQASVVELRFFGGLSVEETAIALDVSPRTVEEDWKMARCWLRRELEAESGIEPRR